MNQAILIDLQADATAKKNGGQAPQQPMDRPWREVKVLHSLPQKSDQCTPIIYIFPNENDGSRVAPIGVRGGEECS